MSFVSRLVWGTTPNKNPETTATTTTTSSPTPNNNAKTYKNSKHRRTSSRSHSRSDVDYEFHSDEFSAKEDAEGREEEVNGGGEGEETDRYMAGDEGGGGDVMPEPVKRKGKGRGKGKKGGDEVVASSSPRSSKKGRGSRRRSEEVVEEVVEEEEEQQEEEIYDEELPEGHLGHQSWEETWEEQEPVEFYPEVDVHEMNGYSPEGNWQEEIAPPEVLNDGKKRKRGADGELKKRKKKKGRQDHSDPVELDDSSGAVIQIHGTADPIVEEDREEIQVPATAEEVFHDAVQETPKKKKKSESKKRRRNKAVVEAEEEAEAEEPTAEEPVEAPETGRKRRSRKLLKVDEGTQKTPSPAPSPKETANISSKKPRTPAARKSSKAAKGDNMGTPLVIPPSSSGSIYRNSKGVPPPPVQDSYISGPFSAKEDRIIAEVVARWCDMQFPKITRSEFCQMIWANSRNKTDFWNILMANLPERNRTSLHKRVKRTYHIFGDERGKWTTEEDRELARIVSSKGMHWTEIGLAVGRMPEDCRDRWRNYLSCGNNRNENTWTVPEEDQLRAILDNMLTSIVEHKARKGELKIPPAENETEDRKRMRLEAEKWHHRGEIDFMEVSHRMDLQRSRLQCRAKAHALWNKDMDIATGLTPMKGRGRKSMAVTITPPRRERKAKKAKTASEVDEEEEAEEPDQERASEEIREDQEEDIGEEPDEEVSDALGEDADEQEQEKAEEEPLGSEYDVAQMKLMQPGDLLYMMRQLSVQGYTSLENTDWDKVARLDPIHWFTATQYKIKFLDFLRSQKPAVTNPRLDVFLAQHITEINSLPAVVKSKRYRPPPGSIQGVEKAVSTSPSPRVPAFVATESNALFPKSAASPAKTNKTSKIGFSKDNLLDLVDDATKPRNRRSSNATDSSPKKPTTPIKATKSPKKAATPTSPKATRSPRKGKKAPLSQETIDDSDDLMEEEMEGTPSKSPAVSTRSQRQKTIEEEDPIEDSDKDEMEVDREVEASEPRDSGSEADDELADTESAPAAVPTRASRRK